MEHSRLHSFRADLHTTSDQFKWIDQQERLPGRMRACLPAGWNILSDSWHFSLLLLVHVANVFIGISGTAFSPTLVFALEPPPLGTPQTNCLFYPPPCLF